MQTSRARSASASSYRSQKPQFQKKYKQRSGSRSVIHDQTSSIILNNQEEDDRRSSNYHIPKNYNQLSASNSNKKRSNSMVVSATKWCALDSDEFRNTSSKLTKYNFKHHDPEQCVCDLCTCGRHLCKFHAIAPNLSKSSQYKRQYTPKKAIPNKVNIAKEYDKLDGPHLQMNSTYLKDYPDKKPDDLNRPKPEDLLKTGGPCPNLTSYSSAFPGYKGENQYVKPEDKHTRGNFPLNPQTSYNKSFPKKEKPKDDWQGIPNNLKLGGTWLGDSTYNKQFKTPKASAYPKHVKVEQKLEINPDYKRQYESSYRNEFGDKGAGVCPAKIELETKKKGKYKNSKINFAEKMDFKALSPQFQAISTSKFSYV